MFMYKFMAGIVETLSGDTPDFDPYKFRKVEHPTTYGETMMHLLKGSIGAGILAMPDACRRVGLILAVIGVISIGSFACYCLQLLIYSQYEICKRHKKGYMAFSKCMRLSIMEGPQCCHCLAGFFYRLVEVMLIVWQLGACSIYFVFIGANVKQVLDFYGHEIPLRLVITYILPLVTLVCLIKKLKLLAPVSTVSNFFLLLGMLLVMFYLVEDDLVFNDTMLQLKHITDIPVFIGLVLFAMEAVGVVLSLEYNMEDPKRFVGCFGLLSIGVAIILSSFLLLGIPGYFKFMDDTKASITLNLPLQEKKAQAAKLIFSFSLFLSIPLQNYVAYEVIWRKTKKMLKERANMCHDYSLRVFLVIVPYIPAVLVPNLGAFMTLLGAVCLSLLAIVFPPIMDICLQYPDKYGPLNFKFYRDIFIIFAGLVCLSSGIYVSILEFTEEE